MPKLNKLPNLPLEDISSWSGPYFAVHVPNADYKMRIGSLDLLRCVQSTKESFEQKAYYNLTTIEGSCIINQGQSVDILTFAQKNKLTSCRAYPLFIIEYELNYQGNKDIFKVEYIRALNNSSTATNMNHIMASPLYGHVSQIRSDDSTSSLINNNGLWEINPTITQAVYPSLNSTWDISLSSNLSLPSFECDYKIKFYCPQWTFLISG